MFNFFLLFNFKLGIFIGGVQIFVKYTYWQPRTHIVFVEYLFENIWHPFFINYEKYSNALLCISIHGTFFMNILAEVMSTNSNK